MARCIDDDVKYDRRAHMLPGVRMIRMCSCECLRSRIHGGHRNCRNGRGHIGGGGIGSRRELLRVLEEKDRLIAELRGTLAVVTLERDRLAKNPTAALQHARNDIESPNTSTALPRRSAPSWQELALSSPARRAAEGVDEARKRVRERHERNTAADGVKVGLPGQEDVLTSGFFRPRDSPAPVFASSGRTTFRNTPERTPTSPGPSPLCALSPKDQVQLAGHLALPGTPGPTSYSPMTSRLAPQRAPGRSVASIGSSNERQRLSRHLEL
jgi:hypothetical protein